MKHRGPSIYVHRGHPIPEEVARAGQDGRLDLVVNYSSDIFLSERFPGIAVELPSRFVPRDLVQALLAQALELTDTWHQGLPEEVYTYRGVVVSRAAPLTALGVFAEALRSIVLAERLIEDRQPSSLVLVDDESIAARALIAVARAHNVRLILHASSQRGRIPGPPTAERLFTARRIVTAKAFMLLATLRHLLDRKTARIHVAINDYFRFGRLIEHLGLDPRVRVWTIAGGKRNLIAELFARHRKTNPVVLPAYINLRAFMRLVRYRRHLARRAKALNLAQCGPRFHGHRLYEICGAWMHSVLRHEFPNEACFQEAGRAFFRKAGITHLLVNQDLYGSNRTLCLAANDLGIETVCYQHGVLPRIPDPPHVSRVLALWGEQAREEYLQRGRGADAEIRMLGDPFITELSARRFDRHAICSRLGLDSSRPIVLVAFERYVNYHSGDEWPSTHNQRLARLCEAMAAFPEVQVLVRFKGAHVYEEFGDSLEIKRRILDRYNRGNIIVDRGGDPYERLHVADAVVVEYSTLGLGAMLFEKPVILVSDDGAADLVDYVSCGAALRVVHVRDLAETLRRVLTDQQLRDQLATAQREFVSWNFANLDDVDPFDRFRASLFGTAHGVELRPAAIA